MKKTYKHWISDETKEAISDKHVIRTKDGSDSIAYKIQKSFVKKMCRIDKEFYIDTQHKILDKLPLQRGTIQSLEG